MVIGNAAYFAHLLGSMYAAIEALDTAGYRGLPEDRWQQTRGAMALDERGHLLVILWIAGGRPESGYQATRYTGRASFMHRFNPDDLATSQSQALAAHAHLVDCLQAWAGSDGARVIEIGDFEIDPFDPQWVDVSTAFTLRIPRS